MNKILYNNVLRMNTKLVQTIEVQGRLIPTKQLKQLFKSFKGTSIVWNIEVDNSDIIIHYNQGNMTGKMRFYGITK